MKRRLQVKGNVFLRLLAFNIMLVIFIMVLPSAIYFQYFKSSYDDQVNQLNMHTITQFRDYMDAGVLKEVVNIPNLYLTNIESNEALTYPLQHDIAGDTIKILQVSKRIDEIRNRFPFIHSIDMYYRKSNLLFLNSNVCIRNHISDCNLNGRENWFKQFSETEKAIGWMSTRLGEGNDAKFAVTYVRSLPYFAPVEGKLGIIAVNIDESAINRMVHDYQKSSGQQIVIISADGRYLSDTVSSQGAASNLEEALIERIKSEDEGIISTQINREAGMVAYTKSQYSPWKYVLITPKSIYYEKSYHIRNFLILVGGILLLVNLFIAYLMTVRMHKPIGSMFYLFTDQISQLNKKLDQSKPILRRNTILQLLSGKFDQHIIAEQEESLGILFNEERLFCFVLHLRLKDYCDFEQEMSLIVQLIESLEHATKHGRIYAIKTEGESISGIVNFSGEQNELMIMKDIVHKIEETSGLKFTLSVGNSYEMNKANISVSYFEANEALPYRFLHQDPVLRYDKLKISKLKDTGSSIRVLNEIEGYVRSSDEQRLKQAIDSVLDEIQSGEYTIEYCKHILMDVVSSIRKALKSIGLSSSQLYGYDIRQYLKRIENVNEFHEWIYDVIAVTMVTLNQKKQNIDKDMALHIARFIEENICNPISLDMVADHVGVSSNYLSKLFKVTMGVNFSDYVTDMKLRHSLQLLKEKKYTVQDISQMIGYNSAHYFIRIFKEKYGITPKQAQKVNFEGINEW
ncbi:AraC family transcriptional regulator [Paenibacillus aceris]|uniref:AraC-like DNA-binding protein n=1 Tax=Paenibacillus aceris TaxID=869555 RepID=A0ABS4HX64_9BACL|nr:AraC family transcriptional regulator [Paenibacillus aceris]MBP1963080.1 AraC-like DNA-binding protein [Paenibacillus aceris]NHW38799.1 AraC family transcriptional regulator [Paenibacillus aceris]